MGPPKSLMSPMKRLMVKSSYRPMTRKEIMETMPSKPMYGDRVAKELVKPSKPRYGAGGTNNPKVQKKKPATKKPVAKKKPKSKAQRVYEEQIKARKRRQKKDPLGRD